MKRILVFPLAAATLLSLVGVASAHPAPYAHRHVYHAPRRAVVVHRAPRVIVHEPAPVVVRRPARVVEQEPESYSLLGIGLRFSGATASGEKAGLSEFENPMMGGVGLQLRSRFGENLGLELSVDVIGGGGDDSFSQLTIPVMAALTYHFLPNSRLQPYLVAGLGVHFTRLEYLDGKYVIDTAELAGQLGGGIELFLSRTFSLHADVRGQTIFRNLDSREQIREDCLNSVGGLTGFCDGIQRANADDKVSLGIQFQLGASLYF